MIGLENLSSHFLSEGTGGRPSTHKSNLAGRVLKRHIEPLGVRGPEPSHIPDCLELILEKWDLFHSNRLEDHELPGGEGVEIVADVALAYAIQGQHGSVDSRKEKGIVGTSFDNKAQELSARVATRMGKLGKVNVVASMDAGLVVARCDYDNGGAVVGTGVASSSVLIPGNPLQDPGIMKEYVTWSGLGTRHFDAIPWGIDIVTAVGFLALNDWWGKRDYVYHSTDEMVTLPPSYVETYSDKPKYLEDSLAFYFDHGRLPEGILKVLKPVTIVGLLNMAFNFPDPFARDVVTTVDAERVIPGKTIYCRPILE